jgi:hypothetical protein
MLCVAQDMPRRDLHAPAGAAALSVLFPSNLVVEFRHLPSGSMA